VDRGYSDRRSENEEGLDLIVVWPGKWGASKQINGAFREGRNRGVSSGGGLEHEGPRAWGRWGDRQGVALWQEEKEQFKV